MHLTGYIFLSFLYYFNLYHKSGGHVKIIFSEISIFYYGKQKRQEKLATSYRIKTYILQKAVFRRVKKSYKKKP